MNGLDLRARFGFEVLRPTKSRSVRLRRRTLDFPLRHGTVSYGGTLEPMTIELAGYMTTTNRAAFLRAALSETRDPLGTRMAGRLVFADDPSAVYEFDSVEFVEHDFQSNQWRLDPDVNTVAAFNITAVLPVSQNALSHSLSEQPQYSDLSAASAGAPEFAILSQSNVAAAGFRRSLLRVFGPATAPVFGSAESGVVHTFDGRLDCLGSLGSIDGVVHGIQDLNLITDGLCEGAGTTGWTASSATLSKVAQTDGGMRVPFGTQILKVVPSAAFGSAIATFTAPANKDLVVRFLVFREFGPSGGVAVEVGPSGSPVATRGALGDVGEWTQVEFTVPTGAGGAWQIRFYTAVSGKTFYLKGVYVGASSITNGSFEGSFAGGVPTGWTLSAGTGAQDTTEELTGANCWRVSFTGSNYVESSAVSAAAGDAFHFSMWAKASVAAGIKVWAIGSTATLNMEVNVSTGWARISGHFVAKTASTFVIRIFGLGASTIYLDDVQVTALSARAGTDSVFFEPGAYGRRLQMIPGECVVLTDSVNRHGCTIVAQVLPQFARTGSGRGSCLIWCAAAGSDNLHQLVWDGGVNALLYNRGAGSSTFVSVTGDDLTVEQWKGSTGRGVLGLVTRFSNGTWLDSDEAGMRLYVERATGGYGMAQAAETDTDLTTTDLTTTPTSIILGDACHWDAFWIWQFPKEFPEKEIAPPEAPINRNRIASYAGNLTAGDSLDIDLERYSAELWTHDAATKKTNAYPDLSGELPDWSECPVLVAASSIPAVQAFIVPEGS
jgi:hypothetical protein